MRLQAGNRVFAPPAWGVALTLIALGVFGSLGNWQLGRAREKQALLAEFEAGSRGTVDANGRAFAELARYQHVRIDGSYDPAHQILIDNMPSPRDGRAGYRVLTAHDGRQGIYLAQAAFPEVIVCDRTTRSQNGCDVRGMLAQDAQTASIPLILITKPFDKQELVARVNEVIRSHAFG